MHAAPLVSIITPYYNASAWLEPLLATVAAQSMRDFEHLIVDDRSTPEQWQALVDRCRDLPGVRVLRMDANGGPAKARNLGIRQARGRFLAFLDADDLWLPDKLASQVRWSLAHGHAFTYHHYRHLSADGQHVGRLVSGPAMLDFRTLHVRRGIGCLTVMIDRLRLPDFQFPELDRGLPEDFLAWAHVTGSGVVGHLLDQDLGRYRLSPNSRSANKLRAALSVWHVYRHVERLPWWRAGSWWLQYVAQAVRLHRRSAPVG